MFIGVTLVKVSCLKTLLASERRNRIIACLFYIWVPQVERFIHLRAAVLFAGLVSINLVFVYLQNRVWGKDIRDIIIQSFSSKIITNHELKL